MKKIALIFSMVAVSILGMSFITISNNQKEKCPQCTDFAEDSTTEPEAYVYSTNYDLDRGVVKVTVKIKNYNETACYRVKVTPTDKFSRVVSEGSLYCTVGNANCYNSAEVTFHCCSGKEGEVKYCGNYDFVATIVAKER